MISTPLRLVNCRDRDLGERGRKRPRKWKKELAMQEEKQTVRRFLEAIFQMVANIPSSSTDARLNDLMNQLFDADGNRARVVSDLLSIRYHICGEDQQQDCGGIQQSQRFNFSPDTPNSSHVSVGSPVSFIATPPVSIKPPPSKKAKQAPAIGLKAFVGHYVTKDELNDTVTRIQNEPPMPKINEQGEKTPCVVCGGESTGLHYGRITCEGCKGFFKRAIQNRQIYDCVGENQKMKCVVEAATRNNCKKCRFRQCLLSGMAPKAVRESHLPGGRNSQSVYHFYEFLDDDDEENEDTTPMDIQTVSPQLKLEPTELLHRKQSTPLFGTSGIPAFGLPIPYPQTNLLPALPFLSNMCGSMQSMQYNGFPLLITDNGYPVVEQDLNTSMDTPEQQFPSLDTIVYDMSAAKETIQKCAEEADKIVGTDLFHEQRLNIFKPIQELIFHASELWGLQNRVLSSGQIDVIKKDYLKTFFIISLLHCSSSDLVPFGPMHEEWILNFQINFSAYCERFGGVLPSEEFYAMFIPNFFSTVTHIRRMDGTDDQKMKRFVYQLIFDENSFDGEMATIFNIWEPFLSSDPHLESSGTQTVLLQLFALIYGL